MSIYLDYGLYALGVLVIILTLWNIRTEMRLRSLLRGKSGESLEATIHNLVDAAEVLHKRQDDIIAMVSNIDGRVKSSIRGVELIRFNPFEDAGSNQSFAIALLNEEGDGVVLSSLYSRDRMSVFAKPVKSLASNHDLTTEEKEVIARAQRTS